MAGTKKTTKTTAKKRPKTKIAVKRPKGTIKAHLILANGAGADQQSPFIRRFAKGLSDRGIAVVTFNFGYQESGRKVPDRNDVLEACYRDVISQTAARFKISEKDVAIGGKSMGGRIATQTAGIVGTQRIVLLGYPLHAPGKEDQLRDKHLYPLNARMLFIWGERDPFCLKSKFDTVRKKLKNAVVFAIPQAGHSLEVPKRSGIDQDLVYAECMDRIAEFLAD